MDQISGRSPVIAVNAQYFRKAIAVKRNVTETDIKTEEETRPTLGRLLVASPFGLPPVFQQPAKQKPEEIEERTYEVFARADF